MAQCQHFVSYTLMSFESTFEVLSLQLRYVRQLLNQAKWANKSYKYLLTYNIAKQGRSVFALDYGLMSFQIISRCRMRFNEINWQFMFFAPLSRVLNRQTLRESLLNSKQRSFVTLEATSKQIARQMFIS